MTGYVCIELSPVQNGYVHCKTWVAQDATSTLTREQVAELGGVLVLFFGAVVGYFMLTKAIKTA